MPEDRVLQRFVHVQIRDRIAILVRFRFLVQRLARAAKIGLVLAHLGFEGDVEELLQRLVLNPENPLRGNDVFPLGVLVDVSLFDQHLDDVRMILFPLVEVIEHVIAIVEQVIAKLVEQLVGRLRRKLL